MARTIGNTDAIATLIGKTVLEVHELARAGVIPPAVNGSYEIARSVQAYIAYIQDGKRIATAVELGEILNMSAKGIHALVRESDMPRERRGTYDVKKCVSWYVERLRRKAHGNEMTSIEEEALLYKREQRKKAEIERMAMERQYVPRTECQDGWVTLAGLAVTTMDSIPARAPSSLINCTTIAQMRDVLRKEIRNARKQLAAELDALTDKLRDPSG